jgi:hypothetical protein
MTDIERLYQEADAKGRFICTCKACKNLFIDLMEQAYALGRSGATDPDPVHAKPGQGAKL